MRSRAFAFHGVSERKVLFFFLRGTFFSKVLIIPAKGTDLTGLSLYFFDFSSRARVDEIRIRSILFLEYVVFFLFYSNIFIYITFSLYKGFGRNGFKFPVMLYKREFIGITGKKSGISGKLYIISGKLLLLFSVVVYVFLWCFSGVFCSVFLIKI